MTRRQRAAIAWILAVLALLAIHVLEPQRSGVIALTEVFEPYIVLSALIAAPFAFRPRSRFAVLVVVLLLTATAGRYGPVWISLPQAASGTPLNVVAWNLEARVDQGTRALSGLGNTQADVVGVEELQPKGADALAADPSIMARLPFQILLPDDETLGIGLLSRYPIVDREVWADPPLIRVVLSPPDAAPFTAIVVHPMPARFGTLLGLPISLDTQVQDDALARIRALVESEVAVDREVVLMGDFNTTEREPAYMSLSQGLLHDSHLDAGLGPGFSWRPRPLTILPFGLIRIDYIFASAGFVTQATMLDCSVPSDHCLIEASLIRTSNRL